jgi:ParB/RepB/Spo0J family partition protein
MNDLEFRTVFLHELAPNSWNPNVMSQEDYDKACESIARFGFIDPITVRRGGSAVYEIIDGENRWRAAKDKGLKTVPVVILEVDDDDARALTIVLNELRGKPDQTRLAQLVADLATRRPMVELERVLPFRRSELAQMVAARREEIDWEALRPPAPVVGVPGEAKERWVERVYRLPATAAAVVDDAIARAGAGGGTQPWQGLEAIAAEFIATHGTVN